MLGMMTFRNALSFGVKRNLMARRECTTLFHYTWNGSLLYVLPLESALPLAETPLTQNACDELFVRYNAKDNIDRLHAVVTEARERKQRGEPPGPDTWRPNLEPRNAVRARTIPILREEKATLEERLAQVRSYCFAHMNYWPDFVSVAREREP